MRSLLKIGLSALLLLAASSAWAQDGLKGAFASENLASAPNVSLSFAPKLAAADFDGDHKPDGAVLTDPVVIRAERSTRTIELHFSARPNAVLTFESSESTVAISAVDVNRDGAADIVVEQPFTHKRLHVWLNDGRGVFREVKTKDFPSSDLGGYERAESPHPQTNFAVIGLPSQRGFDLSPVVRFVVDRPCLTGERAVSAESVRWWSVVEPNCPRAPPVSHLS